MWIVESGLRSTNKEGGWVEPFETEQINWCENKNNRVSRLLFGAQIKISPRKLQLRAGGCTRCRPIY